MTLIIGKGSIEEKVKKELYTNKMIRRQQDILDGKVNPHKPQRGDYKFCEEGAKFLRDIKKYPNESKRISKEYFDWQKSQRKYG